MTDQVQAARERLEKGLDAWCKYSGAVIFPGDADVRIADIRIFLADHARLEGEVERAEEVRSNAWNDFFGDHLTDGNDGYREAAVINRCRAAFDEVADHPIAAATKAALAALDRTVPAEEGEKPIPMLLFCPKCGVQHVDEAKPGELREITAQPFGASMGMVRVGGWANPPHRSHLCHACGCIWRVADVPTEGVARIETTGKADTWSAPPAVPAQDVAGVEEAALEWLRRQKATYPGHEEHGLDGHNARIDWLLAALSAASPSQGLSFQARVQPWMMDCFGPTIAGDRLERGDRFLEEALELLQSGNYPPERVSALRDYVWGRPSGDPPQEVGGVMVTLAAYCLAFGLDMHEAGETELARINVPEVVAKIRAKQSAKPTGSALPIPSSQGEAG